MTGSACPLEMFVGGYSRNLPIRLIQRYPMDPIGMGMGLQIGVMEKPTKTHSADLVQLIRYRWLRESSFDKDQPLH